jgi:hypothetical protein
MNILYWKSQYLSGCKILIYILERQASRLLESLSKDISLDYIIYV